MSSKCLCALMRTNKTLNICAHEFHIINTSFVTFASTVALILRELFKVEKKTGSLNIT